MEINKGTETFYAPTRKHWRKWLEKYGQSKTAVYLILFNKASTTKSVSYPEAVEEALCFGWIDSHKNKRDPESAYQRFSPRKPTSNWSASNRERVARLTKEGLMTEHGQQMINIAKEKGRWEK